jgi:NAD-dependent SIR2 family protein deacetylase
MLTPGIHPSTTASTFQQCPTPISQNWDGLHRSHAEILDVTFLRGSFKTFPESLYLKKIKNSTIIEATHMSLKIIPLCNHTLLPATVKVLETFLEAIL